jgi:hypothetical protein
MSVPGQLQAHGKLLKLPLLITIGTMALLLIGALVWQRSKPGEKIAVVEAPEAATILGNLAFYKEGDEYVLYFSLFDRDQQQIARAGEATIKISQLGTVGIEGGPEFISESVLLDAKIEVGLSNYRWVDIGGGLFFSTRQLIVPTRIAPAALKRVPHAGAKCKIVVEFRDAKDAASKLRQERVFLFP